MVAITPFAANPQNTVYQYTYGTPDVFGPDPYDPNKVPFFAGAALPQTNIVSFQI